MGTPLGILEGGGMAGFGPFQAPPQGGPENLSKVPCRASGGGGLSRETETRDPKLGRRGGGGGLRLLKVCQAPLGV
jgi:hypothetical protein